MHNHSYKPIQSRSFYIVALICFIVLLVVVFVLIHKQDQMKEQIESEVLDESTTEVEDMFVSGRFVEISDETKPLMHEIIFYDTETGVEYLCFQAPYLYAITVLFNADGTPIIYEGGVSR